MSDKYKLNGHKVEPVEDLLDWATWFETANRTVKRSQLETGVTVSTVFLGLDHSFGMTGHPILFETMVFGGPLDQEQARYSTWEEAEKGHAEMLERVSGAKEPGHDDE